MNDQDADRHARLAAASNPVRTSISDASELARLLAAAFHDDPVFDWISRRGPKRAAGLERFFSWVLVARAIPYGGVWAGGGAVAVWLPPGAPATAGGLLDQLRLLPMFVTLCGVPRLLRGQAVADAMEKHHPKRDHFYLAFIAVAPRLQGLGLGSAILEATLRHVDASGAPAYLENSNPRNAALYRRHGFLAQANIAPRGAPPMIAMWRSGPNA